MKLETKFNIGDTVFYIALKKCHKSTVRKIVIELSETKSEVTYMVSDCADSMCRVKVNENDAYKSKDDLINSL